MTGKRLFFLSLIVLSVAMGMHWFKNRPKTRPRRAQPRTALKLDDLQLQDKQDQEFPDDIEQQDADDDDQDLPDDDDTSTDADKPEDDQADDSETDPDKTTTEPDTTAPKPEETTEKDEIASDDPVIIAFQSLRRDPFQRSPYAILMDELRAQRGMTQQDADETEALPSRQVRLLNANFSATIQTERELVAVINSSLYRKGEVFQNREITEIREEYVSLETPNELLLIPKHGVNINIDERGNYTVADTFRQ